MSSFHVGQVVVCVDDSGHPIRPGTTIPVAQHVYTVRAIVMGLGPNGPNPGLLLAEIVNPLEMLRTVEGLRQTERNFATWRFRPAKTTSIEVFTRLLAPAPQKEAAR